MLTVKRSLTLTGTRFCGSLRSQLSDRACSFGEAVRYVKPRVCMPKRRRNCQYR